MASIKLLCAALLLVHCRADGIFEAGQEYQYSYTAFTYTGVKEPAPYGSSFGIRGNLLVQRQGSSAVVKLSDVSLGLHNGPEKLLLSVEFLKKPELTAALEKPFKVHYSNGKAVGLDADASDAEWSVNIKKGIATVLQVDTTLGEELGKDGNAFTRTVEQTVTGNCNTSYSFGAADKGAISLVKQREIKGCDNVPRYSFNSFRAHNCAGKLQEDSFATTQTYYELLRSPKNQLKARLISSFGYQVLQWFPPNGSPFYNLANTTLILKSSGPIAKPLDVKGLTKAHGSLSYTHSRRPPADLNQLDLTKEEDYFYPSESRPQDYFRTETIESLKQVVASAASSPLDDYKLQDPAVVTAINHASSLNLQSLKDVLTQVSGDATLKSTFLDILPYAGSNPAALLIRELILNGQVSDWEARRLVTYFPYYLRLPNEKLLTEFEALLKDNPNIKTRELRGAIGLSFGHLIGVTCSNKLRPCRQDTVSKYSKVLFDRFVAATEHPVKMLTLLTLRNSQLIPALERLAPLAKSGEVSHAIRPQLINALIPLGLNPGTRDRFLAVVTPILLNFTESTEVRIAAANAMFSSNPTFLELQQLVAGLPWERNPEVLNFILTTLRGYANSKNPCIAPITDNLTVLLKRVAYLKTNFFRSNNRVFDYRDAKYGFGGGLQLATVYGGESRIPLIIAARANYRVSEWGYVPAEVYIRLEGVEDTYVRLFRRLDPKEFKLDTLKEILNTIKVAPRVQNPMKVEVVVRSQGYTIFYRHISQDDVKNLAESKAIGELIARGMGLNRNLIVLGGQHFSWRSNDLGLPVGIALMNPNTGRVGLSYGADAGAKGISRSVKADLDFRLQVITYMVAYNPLGVSQGVMKLRGSRVHLPISLSGVLNPVESQVSVKFDTPTEEKPLALLFSSKTVAFVWGMDQKRVEELLKQSCSACQNPALVTKGAEYLKGEVLRENLNKRLGLESHIEVYNCERYSGKSSFSRLLIESVKPSDINSHGSIPGFAVMALMHIRNYFYYYPPSSACSVKAVVHSAKENPASAVEINLKRETGTAATGKKLPPGRFAAHTKGTITILGTPNRLWNVDLLWETDTFNVKSSLNVKVARQAQPELELSSRALCLSVKSNWAQLPDDILETPSAIEPSVQRDITLVWGDAPANECPKVGAKGVASFVVNVVKNITDDQRKAASERTTYPYNQCDADRKSNGRSGIVAPMTEACVEAVLDYATPRSLVYNIKYDQISPRTLRALHRIDTTVKAALVPYWDMHAPHDGPAPSKKNPNSGNIEVKLTFNPRDVDLHVHTDVIHSHYENVEILKPLQAISRNARLQMRQIAAVRTGLVGICVVAPKATVTLDNTTATYNNLPGCWTLASADCSGEPRYAVLVKKSTQSLPLAAKVYIGGNSIELSPSASGVDIKVNDKTAKVDAGKPYSYPPNDDTPIFSIAKVGPRYFVNSPVLKLTFRYTGDDLTLLIPSNHRAQHCGLCGDFNGQYVRDLVGPSGCSLASGDDLVKSYVLKDSKCKENIASPPCSYDGAFTSGKTPVSGIVDFLERFNQ